MIRWQAGVVWRVLLAASLGAGLACGDAPDRSSSASAATAALPDLRPAAPSFSREGDRAIRVSVAVRNVGTARARRSSVAFVLSRDRLRGSDDVALGSLPMRALGAGGRIAVRGTRTLPKALGFGRYRVIACADGRRRVREASERNNCSASTTRVEVGGDPADAAAPTFAGLVSATTCIPGPGANPAISSRFRLSWEPAVDDRTGQAALVYDVYRADKPGGQDLDRPDDTTDPGATSFSTPPLPSDRSWYFVVRARDGAGNRDSNRVERAGEHVCE